MQYRLRTLFVVILLAAVVSAVLARMQYLASWATYHERKGQEYSAKIMQLHATPGRVGSHGFKKQLSDEDAAARQRDLLAMQRHAKLMVLYQRATYRPWTVVNESDVPMESH
jgi:hypothetical protein